MSSFSEFSGPLCPDWLFSKDSNVHVSRDRAWFTEYNPFDTVAEAKEIALPLQVIGIGTVEVPTKGPPDTPGADRETVIRLSNVLHAPTVECNIISGKALGEEYQVNCGTIFRGEESIAYFEGGHEDLGCLVLADSSPFDDRSASQGCDITVSWADKERENWTTYRTKRIAILESMENDWGAKSREGDRADDQREQCKPTWLIEG